MGVCGQSVEAGLGAGRCARQGQASAQALVHSTAGAMARFGMRVGAMVQSCPIWVGRKFTQSRPPETMHPAHAGFAP